jgi:hypothetical protein
VISVRGGEEEGEEGSVAYLSCTHRKVRCITEARLSRFRCRFRSRRHLVRQGQDHWVTVGTSGLWRDIGEEGSPSRPDIHFLLAVCALSPHCVSHSGEIRLCSCQAGFGGGCHLQITDFKVHRRRRDGFTPARMSAPAPHASPHPSPSPSSAAWPSLAASSPPRIPENPQPSS